MSSELIKQYHKELSELKINYNSNIKLVHSKYKLLGIKRPPKLEFTNFDEKMHYMLKNSDYTLSDIIGLSRKEELKMYRFAIIYIFRNMEFFTLVNIAFKFNRNHATILNSLRKMQYSVEFPKQNSMQYDIYTEVLNNYKEYINNN